MQGARWQGAVTVRYILPVNIQDASKFMQVAAKHASLQQRVLLSESVRGEP